MTSRLKLIPAIAFAFALCLGAQESPSGWRRIGDQPPAPPSQAYAAPHLILPAGAWVTARVDQPLSSDHNRQGDTFTATLVEPLVANGFVVARRGQTVSGRVATALKAGRVKGTSELSVEITEINLVDGQHLPIRTQMVEFAGGTSMGRDAAAVGTTTGVGAAIGAAAGGGFGAGMGAIGGAVVSTIGVLATRGHASVIYPETPIKFRTLEPLPIMTSRSAEQVFQPVRQEDYEPRQLQRRMGPSPPPQYYGGGYYGGYYPYYPYSYFGPRFHVYGGPGFYFGRGHGRRW